MTPPQTHVLRLFVSGKGALSKRAQDNIQRICDEDLGGEFSIEIIDILTEPEKAEEERILATPTLIKSLPPPLRRVIGDLTDRGVVLAALGIHREGNTDA